METKIDTRQFVGEVRPLLLKSIRPSADNPRGKVDKDESFDRLVTSISEVGILVPLVVKQLAHEHGEIKYELVDGERRFWAATELGKAKVPAHVLKGANPQSDLRKLMFHLHMMREQWGALAQCRALAEIYPRLSSGVALAEKAHWAKRLAKETGMTLQLAKDRIHVLCWPKPLKEELYEFETREAGTDIYSYVLAIEASVIEPSVRAFPEYYNQTRSTDEAANDVRRALFTKTLVGIRTGAVRSRDQIRSVVPLFSPELQPSQRRIAQSIFQNLVSRKEFQFDDARAEIVARLPEVSKEKYVNPRRAITAIKSLTKLLKHLNSSDLDGTSLKESVRKKLRTDLLEAVGDLENSIRDLKTRF